MQNLNVGIVGCGYAGDIHIGSWRRAKGAKLVAVCDIDEAKAAETAKHWGLEHYTNLEEMCKKGQISVVSIVTPPTTHAQLAIQAMELGCDVLVEKPFTDTYENADAVIECIKRTGRKLTVSHNRIFCAPWQRARSLMAAGDMGDITGMTLTMLTSHLDDQARDENHWAHRLKGGFFGESMPHLIYPFTSVLGNCQVKHVSATKVGRLPWMPLDELAVTLVSDNGVLGSIYWHADATTQEHITDIYGSKMSLKVNEFTYTLIKNKALFPEGSGALGNLLARFRLNTRVVTQTISSTIRSILSVIRKRSAHQVLPVVIEQFMDSIRYAKPLPVEPAEAREVVRLTGEICDEVERIKAQGQLK